MPLAAGTKLGPYEIKSSLGAGGMGEVYLADDSRLGRSVAIKILPERFSRDAERMARFDREAKVLASLNHPNIAAIYGVEEANGVRALVMEWVGGQTLAECIQQGSMPVDEALTIAKQVAEALEYAHERNIIHRDLKPANAKITPDSAAKVLDFGLAKALEGDVAITDISNSPTLSLAATQAGVLLGTAAYMSPEQARGKKVDRRTDIWAFGAVLYEMLTRKQAFAGETISDTLAAVIRAEPDWSVIPQDVSRSIVQLLRRCLTKDPNQRLRDIGEARIALERVLAGTAEDSPMSTHVTAQPAARWRSGLPWVIAATGVILAAVALSSPFWRAKRDAPKNVMQLSVALPENLAGVFDPNPGCPFAISPDGSQIVFVGGVSGKTQLYLRPMDKQAATPVAGTENATEPFFSPDGQSIGFFSQGKMRKVSLHGGPGVVLADAPVPHGAYWTSADNIIYSPNFGSGLMLVPSGGGTVEILTRPNGKSQEISHRWPQVLPGGKYVLFTIQMGTQATYDDAEIALLSLETKQWHTLFKGGSYARYVPSAHIVYAHGGSLMAVPFDLARMELHGAAVPVQEGVVTTFLTSGGAEYDVTPDGLLVFVPGSARPPMRSLVLLDRSGVAKTLSPPPRVYSAPRLSPDGKQLAVQVNDSDGTSIWIYDFARDTMTRLTFGPGNRTAPVWTADGRKIIYATRATTASPSFRSKMADGSGKEDVLSTKEFEDPGALPFALSPDGRTLLFGSNSSSFAGRQSVHTFALDGSEKVQPFLQSSSNFTSPHFSPDGHWVAYMSDESGRREICVQPFPGPGGKWLLSTEGGEYPRWAGNGRELFFVSGERLMSVALETQPVFKAASPRPVIQTTGYLGAGNYDVMPDAQHFLMIRQNDSGISPKELNVVLNWFDELKRLAPAENK